jgi:hypothetical protein
LEGEALDTLHYSPINVNGGVLTPPFPVYQYQLLCLAAVDGQVVVLVTHCQVSDLLSNLMMVLESWAMQSRVNREYRRRLSTHC